MSTASSITPPPRFRGKDSAVSKFGTYAVHIIGKMPYLYKSNELLGALDDIPASVTKVKSAATCIAEARKVLSQWDDLQVQPTLADAATQVVGKPG